MSAEYARLRNEIEQLFDELDSQGFFFSGETLVIGCSTSEVIGERIGSHSSLEAAEIIFSTLQSLSEKHHLDLIFQGCEHINRALTLERRVAERLNAEIVSVVPHRQAGGSLSEYAYRHLSDAVVVEKITADAGIDIGQTLIGMHIRPVAVPVRTNTKKIGEAVVTIAKSRPKLIGGPRAKYQ